MTASNPAFVKKSEFICCKTGRGNRYQQSMWSYPFIGCWTMIAFKQEQVYLYSNPIDMRKSINGLSYLMSDLPNHHLKDGSLTLFYNRCRDKVKLLYWDKNGYVLIYKRLEKGRFKITKQDEETGVVTLDNKQLSWLLAGLDYDLMAQNKTLDFSGFY